MDFLFRAIMTHRLIPIEQRNELGIKDNFLRMSIGLENADDLIKDLDQALKKAVKLKIFYL